MKKNALEQPKTATNVEHEEHVVSQCRDEGSIPSTRYLLSPSGLQKDCSTGVNFGEKKAKDLAQYLHLPNAEIATKFGLTKHQVKMRLLRAGFKRKPGQVPPQRGLANGNFKHGKFSGQYKYKKNARAKNPQHAVARNAVYRAVKSGRLKKAPCHCGDLRVQAHHADYSRPLEVTWLCRRHHLETHVCS